MPKSRITAISQAPATAAQAGEDQTEELSDGQKLQVIESVGGEADATRDRRIERIPDEIVQFHREARRPSIAWPRDLDMLAGLKHDAAEHPSDRLREARSGILGRRTCIGISAVPRRGAA